MPEILTPTPIIPGAAAQVATPREPSASELSAEFTMPDFLADPSEPAAPAAEQPTTPTQKVTSEVKVVEVKKDPEPVKPLVAEKEAVKPEVTTERPRDEKGKFVEKGSEKGVVPSAEVKGLILPVGVTQKERDYTGYSPEEIAVFKQMSHDAFRYTSDLIKEKRELSKLKDSSYLQHPMAYTLSPEYTKLQEDAYYTNAEAQFWQQQAINIAEGKEWFELKSWDKNGSPVVGAAQAPTTAAAENARKYSNYLFSRAQGFNDQVQQFSGRYKQQIENDAAVIQQECAKHFGWVADPKLLDEKVSNSSIGEQTIKQVRENFIQLFPPYLQNSVGVQIAAHTWAALQIYRQKIDQLENGKQVAAVKEEEKSLIEPTSKEQPRTTNGAPTNPRGMWETKEFSTEGMPV